MKQLPGVWHVGFQCDGCRTYQAIMEDPERGKGKTVPEMVALNLTTHKMESVYDPQGVTLSCEGCHQPNVLRAKDLKRWRGVR